MSWSVYTISLPKDVNDRVNALEPPGVEFAPRDDQVKAAKAAAIGLVESGAVGKGEAFQITLSGHANENHEPASGYGNDMVGVGVAQVAASAVEQFDQAQAQAQRNQE